MLSTSYSMLCSDQAPFLLGIYYMAPWTVVPVFSYSNFAVIRLVVIVHNTNNRKVLYLMRDQFLRCSEVLDVWVRTLYSVSFDIFRWRRYYFHIGGDFSVGSGLHAHDQGLIFFLQEKSRLYVIRCLLVQLSEPTQVGRIHATHACTLVTVGSRVAPGHGPDGDSAPQSEVGTGRRDRRWARYGNAAAL